MKSSHPYEYIDRNVKAVQSKQDYPPANQQRELKDIENGMIDDTISLIELLDGSTQISDRLLLGERQSNKSFDVALYLDKSARPVRQLTHALWGELSAKNEPRALFLNIDKRPWLKEMGFVDNETTNQEAIDPTLVSLDKIDHEMLHNEITHIRALYVEGNIDENNLQEVWDKPTRLDGKTIAIIDEVKSSGNTLRIATELMHRAVPDASIEGMWWSTPEIVTWEGGEHNNFERQKAATIVPVWYDKSRESGRGIGDIDEFSSEDSPSKAQRIGRSILSAPERDENGNYASNRTLSAVIRRDLGRLATRYKNGELTQYKPSDELPDEEYDKRVERYYKQSADVIYKQWQSEQGR